VEDKHQLQHNNCSDSGLVENIIFPVTTIIYSLKKQFMRHYLFLPSQIREKLQ